MRSLGVNETKITTNNALHWDNFVTEDNQEYNNDKKNCLRYFYRLLTSDLTLRPQNNYMNVFRALFEFLSHFPLLLVARIKLVKFYTKFRVKQVILTHFSPVSYFYTPWKRQKTKGFLTFSWGIEMWHWTKTG